MKDDCQGFGDVRLFLLFVGKVEPDAPVAPVEPVAAVELVAPVAPVARLKDLIAVHSQCFEGQWCVHTGCVHTGYS